MLALLDIQHAGKPSRPSDMGAAFDLDGDGVTGENGEREVDLVRAYVAAAKSHLEAHGVVVEVLTAGEYGTRHVKANALAAGHAKAVYVACHVNAGKGDYGLVEYDARSPRGAQLADLAAADLRALPGIKRGVTKGLGAGDRGFSCIDGIYAGPKGLCAILYEPGFIDAPAHRGLWTAGGLVQVGCTLALTLEAWAA